MVFMNALFKIYYLVGENEKITNITGGFPYWSNTILWQFVNNSHQIPFDTHLNVALVAPVCATHSWIKWRNWLLLIIARNHMGWRSVRMRFKDINSWYYHFIRNHWLLGKKYNWFTHNRALKSSYFLFRLIRKARLELLLKLLMLYTSGWALATT